MPYALRDDRCFYKEILPFENFGEVVNPERYQALPSDWIVALADVVDSTQAISAGKYKAVNAAGAAVIAAVRNALPSVALPFSFGGDGATVAISRTNAEIVGGVLARTAAWVEDSLGLTMRIAQVPVVTIREAGADVRVARFAASENVAYAMFAGGGLTWAEAQAKTGRFNITRAARGMMPNLDGLYCGFAPVKAKHDVILSVIVVPVEDNISFAGAVSYLLMLLNRSDNGGRPLPDTGPLPSWRGGGLEAALAGVDADRGALARAADAIRAAAMRLTLSAGIPIGEFRPRRYLRQLVENTDFRKFDDGLRMTIDCTSATADAVETYLLLARESGACHFGIHRQESANLTCYVPSRIRSDHVHFVDGATGGFAAAAAKLKAQQVR
jgi:hypothetical protein